MQLNVIGAGLAGCEAAYKIANNGYKVNLYDMKPGKFSPAYKNKNFAELVCSNSLKAKRIDSAAGLLKEEMRLLNSLMIKCALECEVPAGGALAVDRSKFSALVTQTIRSHENIRVFESEIEKIPRDGINILATGPLTSDKLVEDIEELCGKSLSFYDAAAPIITFESIDMNNAFFASRYDKGLDKAYINCPMNKVEYENFYESLVSAQRVPLHDFEKDILEVESRNSVKVYEGCMPVEVMAERGRDTLRFGPLKPVGLRDPKTGHRPWAVVQLRKENIEGSLYNMVGFQTNLKFPEQKRVFGIIPALKNADFVRYGVMHRNTFIDSPRVLKSDFSLKDNSDIFFAGQITGVEGYMESAFSGIVAGINAVRKLQKKDTVVFPKETMIGSLSNYIADEWNKDFQPMGANFGILPAIEPHIRDKKERYMAFAKRSLELMKKIIVNLNIE